MSLAWHHVERNGVSIWAVSGSMQADDDVGRFTDAFDWVRKHSYRSPVLLDMGGVQAWSTGGETAVLQAAGSLSDAPHSLAVCGISRQATPRLYDSGPVKVYPDQEAAMAELGQSPG